ncbi:MAG: CHAP domain-containing protein [Akkermansiaceae bacterium]|nr:CHAP domain-containing protein [Akkermansiaceae bacterium]
MGAIVDRERGVAIHSNGKDCYESHGEHYSNDDGYYYGRCWQCVEFVKRYYHDRFHHHMPDVWGHAKSFFNTSLKHGEINRDRALVQYRNGGDEKPRAEDLLVYTHGEYGHVAIISKVEADSVEVVQQNIAGLPRVRLPLVKTADGWLLGGTNKPAGWLRLPPHSEGGS